MSIEIRVIEIIKEKCMEKVEKVELNSRFIDDLGFDSLSLISLCIEIEEEFDFELDDMDIVGVLTVKNMIDACNKAYVNKNL
ncbi:MAG: acyl carrier protein [Lachnospiraceae bacterium]|nr:acyl carrier protein [Lachnospiraceae bacterium]